MSVHFRGLTLSVGILCITLGALLLTGGTPVWAMSAGTHMIVGAGFGYKFAGSQEGAFAAGMVSHAALDAIPHYDWPEWVQALTFIAGVLVTNDLYNRSGQDQRVLWGAIGGMLPDIEHLLVKLAIIKRKQEIFPSHTGIIRQPRAPQDTGAFLELGVNGLALVLLF